MCDAVNYQPVSLTCVTCKLLSTYPVATSGTISTCIMPLSCESQLLTTTQDLLSRLDHMDEVDVGMLDFPKAFYVVLHQMLKQKLRLYGIEGRTSNWISSFLLSRTQSVLVDGVCSQSCSFAWGKTWGLPFNVSKCNILHLAWQVDKPVRFYTIVLCLMPNTYVSLC